MKNNAAITASNAATPRPTPRPMPNVELCWLPLVTVDSVDFAVAVADPSVLVIELVDLLAVVEVAFGFVFVCSPFTPMKKPPPARQHSGPVP